jgi:hypothetical protein
MTEPKPFDPDAYMGKDEIPISKQTPQGGVTTNREAQPISQDDAIILKDQKDEFERTPVPPATYDAIVDQCNYAWDNKGKPKMVVVWKIKGPTQIGRLYFMHLAARGNDFGATRLKQFMARAQRVDDKGQWRSLIDFVDATAPFDEKKFCDSGIAIGAEAKIVLIMGKPYTDKVTGKLTPSNNLKDILLPSTGEKFM